jgi:hypothetical protein
MSQIGQRQSIIASSSPRWLVDKFGLCFLNLVLSREHSDLMLDGDRRRKFDFPSKPVRAHWALLWSTFIYVWLEENHSLTSYFAAPSTWLISDIGTPHCPVINSAVDPMQRMKVFLKAGQFWPDSLEMLLSMLHRRQWTGARARTHKRAAISGLMPAW